MADFQELVSLAGVEFEAGSLGVGGAEGEAALNQSHIVSFSMLAWTRRW